MLIPRAYGIAYSQAFLIHTSRDTRRWLNSSMQFHTHCTILFIPYTEILKPYPWHFPVASEIQRGILHFDLRDHVYIHRTGDFHYDILGPSRLILSDYQINIEDKIKLGSYPDFLPVFSA